MEEIDKNVGIYVITNLVNGKKYVGQSINLDKRKNDYKYLHCKEQPKLYNSIKKYSWENFSFEVVVNCKREELNELEFNIHQKYYDELGKDKMLNCRAGGGQNVFCSQETKDKISKKRLGRKFTKEHVENLSNANRKRWETYTHNEETLKKISESSKGRVYSDETKKKMSGRLGIKNPASVKVNQYSLQGEYIKTWDSIADFGRFYGKRTSCISSACNGKLGYVYESVWRYFDDNKECNNIFVELKIQEVKVNQYSLQGEYIKTWDSIADIGKFFNKDMYHVSRCCNGKHKQVNGFVWRNYKTHSDCTNLIL